MPVCGDTGRRDIRRWGRSLDLAIVPSGRGGGPMVSDPTSQGAEAVVKRSGLVGAAAMIAGGPRFEARCTGGFGRGLRGLGEGRALGTSGPERSTVGGL